jgi:hypothetical protein
MVVCGGGGGGGGGAPLLCASKTFLIQACLFPESARRGIWKFNEKVGGNPLGARELPKLKGPASDPICLRKRYRLFRSDPREPLQIH